MSALVVLLSKAELTFNNGLRRVLMVDATTRNIPLISKSIGAAITKIGTWGANFANPKKVRMITVFSLPLQCMSTSTLGRPHKVDPVVVTVLACRVISVCLWRVAMGKVSIRSGCDLVIGTCVTLMLTIVEIIHALKSNGVGRITTEEVIERGQVGDWRLHMVWWLTLMPFLTECGERLAKVDLALTTCVQLITLILIVVMMMWCVEIWRWILSSLINSAISIKCLGRERLVFLLWDFRRYFTDLINISGLVIFTGTSARCRRHLGWGRGWLTRSGGGTDRGQLVHCLGRWFYRCVFH